MLCTFLHSSLERVHINPIIYNILGFVVFVCLVPHHMHTKIHWC